MRRQLTSLSPPSPSPRGNAALPWRAQVLTWCNLCLVATLLGIFGCRPLEETTPTGTSTSATGASSTSSGGELGAGGSGDATTSCETDAKCKWPEETCACSDCRFRLECACKTDGICSPSEPCECADCSGKPWCKVAGEGECIDDSVCLFPFEACQCADCQLDPMSCPSDCEPDGTCDIHDSCTCVDCKNAPACATALSSCEGGVPDGSCKSTEACTCVDCHNWGRCTQPFCDAVGECSSPLVDWCICPGCWELPSCVAAITCEDDHVCSVGEGCRCADCAAAPTCQALGLAQGCQGSTSDGVCSDTEGCNCVDCANTVNCMLCNNDGYCGTTEGCLCPDCEGIPGAAIGGAISSWWNQCYPGWGGGGIPCVNDGICRPWSEGCGCADCMQSSHCADNVASCEGGAPNGTCSDADPCSCPDCHWSGKCVELACDPPDGICGESRLCPDCVVAGSITCIPDGYCNDLDEGCDCEDCSNAPTCNMP